MSLNPTQLATLEADMASLVAAATADALATLAVATDTTAASQAQATLQADTANAIVTGTQVEAAGAQLLADANADFPPAPPPTSADDKKAQLIAQLKKGAAAGGFLAALEAFLASPAGQALIVALLNMLTKV